MSYSLLYILLCCYDVQDDYTALHHAVHRGHLAITVALLHRGAKINAAGKVLYDFSLLFVIFHLAMHKIHAMFGFICQQFMLLTAVFLLLFYEFRSPSYVYCLFHP